MANTFQVLSDISWFIMFFDIILLPIIKNGGIFYFSNVRPAFYDCHWEQDEKGFRKNKVMSKYLSNYSFENEFWSKTTHYHRTISDYLNDTIKNGFILKNIKEPVSYDGITKSKEYPLFFFAEFTNQR